jgi:hypothetical protein
MQVLMADFFMADQLTSQVNSEPYATNFIEPYSAHSYPFNWFYLPDPTTETYGIRSMLLHGWNL